MTDENSQKPEEDKDVTIEQDENLDDSVVAEESAQETIKKLREKLKKCVEDKQEYLTSWQKDKAEFLNARKRDEEAKKQFLQFANENLVTELIPVLDSFDIAFSNKEVWEKVDLNWRMGVQYIYSQMLKILEQHNVKVINPVGEDYNPSLHEAVELIETQKQEEDGKVLTVINKGYSLAGKIIRSPKVKVGEIKK